MATVARIVALALAIFSLGGGVVLASNAPQKPSAKAPTCASGLKCPDLHVAFKSVNCSASAGNGKYHVNAKVDIRNYPVPSNQHKTWKTFETKVTLNGQPLSPNPHSVAPTMWGGQHQETNFTIEAAPGTYTLVATIDATGQQPEYHYDSNQGGGNAEGDNTATKKITVPGGC